MVNLVFVDIKLILWPGSMYNIQVLYVKHPRVDIIFYVIMGVEQAEYQETLKYVTLIKISRSLVSRF